MAVPAALIAELRRLTGASVMECRRVLEETRGDLESAARVLRAARRDGPPDWMHALRDQGPDHFMEVTVAPADAEALRDLARAVDPSGFVRTEISGRGMFSEFRPPIEATFDLYCDAHHNGALLGNIRGTASTNIWTCQTLMVGAARLWIEHGYGSSGPETLAGEMRLLSRLAEGVGPAITGWSVEFGGQGHTHGVAAAGTTGTQLAAYLGGV
jgi:hypothetical protein